MPWIWSAVAMTVIAAILLLSPAVFTRRWRLAAACVLAFCGIWIEKGMGLIIPGFIPSTLYEIVEYRPSLMEWKISAGIWALGFMIYTVALKVTLNVFRKPSAQGGDSPLMRR